MSDLTSFLHFQGYMTKPHTTHTSLYRVEVCGHIARPLGAASGRRIKYTGGLLKDKLVRPPMLPPARVAMQLVVASGRLNVADQRERTARLSATLRAYLIEGGFAAACTREAILVELQTLQGYDSQQAAQYLLNHFEETEAEQGFLKFPSLTASTALAFINDPNWTTYLDILCDKQHSVVQPPDNFRSWSILRPRPKASVSAAPASRKRTMEESEPVEVGKGSLNFTSL